MPFGRADFNYRIIRWSKDGRKRLDEPGGLDSLAMAEAAYQAAVLEWGADEMITLQQGARVIRKSREDG